MLLFTILWGVALLRVLFSPVIRSIRITAFVCCILGGFWLIGGVLVYSGARAHYETQRETLQEQRREIEAKKTAVRELARIHPTSRDVLRSLYVLAYRLGDDTTMKKTLESLKSIDPNHPDVALLK